MFVFDNIATPDTFYGFSYIKLNNEYIITFGGININDIYYYSIKEEKWYKTNIKLKNKIRFSCVSKYGDIIHVIGGHDYDNSVDLSSFYKFDIIYKNKQNLNPS